MANPISTGSARRGAGFTYLGLIILLAVMGLVAAAGIKMGTVMQRAAAEEELLEIGAQFSQALRSYAAATPKGQVAQPPTLQELLKDPRFPNPTRHLRKIFIDPVTGSDRWGVTYLGGDRGVVAVYSLSDKRPLKVANFDARFQNFENKEKLSEWKFTMAGAGALLPPLAPVAPIPPAGAGATPTPPSLFGQGTGTPSGTPMTPPAQAPETPAPEAPPDDQPMEPPPDQDEPAKDGDDKANPAPPDDGRVDETRKAERKDEPKEDPKVPVKRPVNRR
ncbi:MAG: type II secretion system protein [Pseudomonadota bacterium]